MSDSILKLIPTFPAFVPCSKVAEKACEMLATYFPVSDGVNCRVSEKTNFVDPGGNWERVRCPVCGTELDQGWWQQAMDVAHQTDFVNLAVDLPCCASVASLNDLRYEQPAGFARFVLEVRNPGRGIDDGQLVTLEKTLKCKLRKIWAHY